MKASEVLLLSDEQLDNPKNSNDLLGMIFSESTNTSSNANQKPLEKSSSSSSNVKIILIK